MKSDLLVWLAGTGSWVWHTALTLFLLLNATAIVALLLTRNRALCIARQHRCSIRYF